MSSTNLFLAPHRSRNHAPRVSALVALIGWVGMVAAGMATLATAAQGQEPASPSGSFSAEVNEQADAVLAEGLQQRYEQIESFEKLRVAARAGVVTVSGTTLSETAREEALDLAARVDGVVRVRDEIEVILDPRERLRPAVDEALGRLQLLVSYLPLLAVALVLIGLFYLLARLVGRWRGLFARLTPNRFAQDLLRQAVMVAVFLAGVLIALEILDATALVGAVLGAAGVIGLALGFAFRDLVENYVASILLSIRQPFAPNDHVDIDGRSGKVVRLTSRATILMTLDGNHLRIPNAQVFKGIVLNYTRNPLRRFDFGVGVGVGEDLTAALRLGIDTVRDVPGVLADPPPAAVIEGLGDSNVPIRFYGWVDQRASSFGKVKGESIRRVKTVLEAAGMDLPEPIYRVHMVSTVPTEREGTTVQSAARHPESDENTVVDLDPDHSLDRQIAADRSASGEGKDLLDVSGLSE